MTPVTQDIEIYRGDTTVLPFAYAGLVVPDEIRFYVRERVDGDVVLRLVASEEPAQFSFGGGYITVTVSDIDTDGANAGWWRYDLEVTVAGIISTIYAGHCRLKGDYAAAGSGGGVPMAYIDRQLVEWTESEAFQFKTVTYDSTYVDVVSTATVQWPDGSAGVFTAVTINATFEVIDAFTVTHTDSGRTVTQAAVTRNANGMITVKPVLTVA